MKRKDSPDGQNEDCDMGKGMMNQEIKAAILRKHFHTALGVAVEGVSVFVESREHKMRLIQQLPITVRELLEKIVDDIVELLNDKSNGVRGANHQENGPLPAVRRGT